MITLLLVLEVTSLGSFVWLYLRNRAQVDALRAEVALARIEGVLGQADLDPQHADRRQQG